MDRQQAWGRRSAARRQRQEGQRQRQRGDQGQNGKGGKRFVQPDDGGGQRQRNQQGVEAQGVAAGVGAVGVPRQLPGGEQQTDQRHRQSRQRQSDEIRAGGIDQRGGDGHIKRRPVTAVAEGPGEQNGLQPADFPAFFHSVAEDHDGGKVDHRGEQVQTPGGFDQGLPALGKPGLAAIARLSDQAQKGDRGKQGQHMDVGGDHPDKIHRQAVQQDPGETRQADAEHPGSLTRQNPGQAPEQQQGREPARQARPQGRDRGRGGRRNRQQGHRQQEQARQAGAERSIRHAARRSGQGITEVLFEQVGELRGGELVPLIAPGFDLDLAHETPHAAGGLPILALHQALQQAGAVGVPATGGVNHLPGRGGGDVNLPALCVDDRPGAAAGDHQGLHQIQDRAGVQTGLVRHQLPFVIIEDQPGGALEALQQFGFVQHRHILAGVENKRDVRRRELAGVLQHALPAIRGDDAYADALGHGHRVLVGMRHGPQLESGDLVVVQVRGDEALGGEHPVYDLDVARVYAALLQPGPVGREVRPHRPHGQAIRAQELHVVGDVARTAAELALHLRHHETHIQEVDFFRQDVVPEGIQKRHDMVIGEGAADKRSHGRRGQTAGKWRVWLMAEVPNQSACVLYRQ